MISFLVAWEHAATSSPGKPRFQAPEAPGAKLCAMDLASRCTFAGTLMAREAEDAMHCPGGSADTLPEPGWQELPRQMLAHISQQKHSRVVTIQERGRATNKILKVKAWCAREIWFFPNYFI